MFPIFAYSVTLIRLIDEEQSQIPLNDTPSYGWKQYYQLSEIYGWLDEMLSKYPNLLTHLNYGKSYEGRPLRAVKVSHKKVWKILINC